MTRPSLLVTITATAVTMMMLLATMLLTTTGAAAAAASEGASAPPPPFKIHWQAMFVTPRWATYDDNTGITFIATNNVRYARYNNSNITALDRNGKFLWNRTLDVAPMSDQQPAGRREQAALQVYSTSPSSCVVLAVAQFFVQGLDCLSGKMVFNRTDLASIWGAPGAFDKSTGMYFTQTCTQQCLQSWAIGFDVLSGKVKWNVSQDSGFSTTSFIGKTIVAFHNVNYAWFYNKDSGKQIGNNKTQATWENLGFINYFVCGGDTLVLQLGSRSMMTIDMNTGKMLWSSPADASNYSFAGGDADVASFIISQNHLVEKVPCRWPNATLNNKTGWPKPAWKTPGQSHGQSQVYNYATVVPVSEGQRGHRNDGVVIAPLTNNNNVYSCENNTVFDLETGKEYFNLVFTSQVNSAMFLVSRRASSSSSSLMSPPLLHRLQKPSSSSSSDRIMWTFQAKVTNQQNPWQNPIMHAVALDVEAGGKVVAQLPTPVNTNVGGKLKLVVGQCAGDRILFTAPNFVACVELP